MDEGDEYEPENPYDEYNSVPDIEEKIETYKEYLEYLEDLDLDSAEEVFEKWESLDKNKINTTITSIEKLKLEIDDDIKKLNIIHIPSDQRQARYDQTHPVYKEEPKQFPSRKKWFVYPFLNEQFLRMQKLAGLITESEYKEKKRALIEYEVLRSERKPGIGKDGKSWPWLSDNTKWKEDGPEGPGTYNEPVGGAEEYKKYLKDLKDKDLKDDSYLRMSDEDKKDLENFGKFHAGEIKDTASEYTRLANYYNSAISDANTYLKVWENSLKEDDYYEPEHPELIPAIKEKVKTYEKYLEDLEDLDILPSHAFKRGDEAEKAYNSVDKDKLATTVKAMEKLKLEIDNDLKKAKITFSMSKFDKST